MQDIKIEFINTPPIVSSLPKLDLSLFAKALIEATLKYKKQKEEKLCLNEQK